MTTPSRNCAPAESRFNTAYLRSLVEAGRAQGLIRGPTDAATVIKNGQDVAQIGLLRSQWMDVSPALARQWLENNFRNRPLKEDVVLAYARDMRNGIWVATHQGVAFNDRDELIDGQHRLHAIVRAELTVRLMVTFGLPATIKGKEMTTMDAVDRGRTRSVADQLTIQHGHKHGAITASICSSIAGICCETRTRRLSVGETLDIYRAFESSIAWVIEHRPKVAGLRAAGVLGGFAFAIAADASPQIRDLFLRFVTGAEIAPRSPIAQLRQFLLSEEATLLSRGTARGIAELVLQALYLETQVERPPQLELALDGVRHFRALQPARVAQVAAHFTATLT